MDDPRPQQARLDFLTLAACKVAAVDPGILKLCPEQDAGNVRAVASLMLCTLFYVASLLAIISHKLFADPGQIRIELLAAAVFIASFLATIDSYTVMRSGWHLSGIQELKRGGIDLSTGPGATIKTYLFLTIRLTLSVGLAQLMAIFLSLLVFGSDIRTDVATTNARANAPIVADATLVVDKEIARATNAVTAQEAAYAALYARTMVLRQSETDPLPDGTQVQPAQQEVTQLLVQKTKTDDEVRAAEIYSSRRARTPQALERLASAKERAVKADRAVTAARARLERALRQSTTSNEATRQHAHDRLPDYETRLAAEDGKLNVLKDGLANLVGGREEAIRKAAERMPGYVPPAHGLLAEIAALEHIAQADNKIAAVIVLIDLTSFGFELAAVLAKVFAYVPSTYAALLARNSYLQVVRIVNDMMDELNPETPEPPAPKRAASPPIAANDNHIGLGTVLRSASSGAPEEPPPPPPKRPRGRPRKNSVH